MSTSIMNPIRLRLSLLIVGSLIGIASFVSIFSIGDRWSAVSPLNENASATSVAMPDEMVLPQGMHLAEFQTSCMICHSPRLALNQPTFPKEKWGEIVHKMVAVYGAPITKDDEPLIVEYLMAAQATR